jgi:hypothetical protein
MIADSSHHRAASGGLPLLSFALAELWEARGRERNLSAQTARRRASGALARHGDS